MFLVAHVAEDRMQIPVFCASNNTNERKRINNYKTIVCPSVGKFLALQQPDAKIEISIQSKNVQNPVFPDFFSSILLA